MEDRKNELDKKRSFIDDHELSEGHNKRFETLLKQTFPINKKVESATKMKIIFIYVSIAAALILVVGMSLRYYQSTYSTENIAQQKEIEVNPLSEEFIETNQYFSQQMNEEIENIKCKLPYTDENNRKQLTSDIDELLRNNQSFVTEIQQSQDEELAINYLVQHYRTNIATLEFINEKLGKYIKC